jgi:hypothetical protein
MGMLVLAWLTAWVAGVQTGTATRPEVQAAIAQLGSFDFATRTRAAQVVRRAPAQLSAPLLQEAVRGATDEYVRFRAFVLLTGTDAVAADRVARDVLGNRDDRLRMVAYQWFELHPKADVLPRLLAALKAESSEFVRPALTRALAASAADPRVREALAPLVMRGEDIFRGSVIAALGDYGGTFAVKDIAAVAKLDGPLQEDAVTALGRLGWPDATQLLADLQQKGRPDLQPTVSASLCLLGIDCDARLAYLTSTLTFAAGEQRYQPLLRGAVHALAMLAIAGHEQALATLFDVGTRSQESARAPIALGVGLVALRDPARLLTVLDGRADRASAAELVRDAFDMLSEDFDEEQFAVFVRTAFAQSPEASTRHATAGLLVKELEY